MRSGDAHCPARALQWVTLWLLLLTPVLALATITYPHLRHVGIAQGLAQGSGNAIAQGPNGILWLGTEAGLQRYDGYGFVTWHHVLGDPNSLSRDGVRAIAVAADGSVWVATNGGGLDRLKPDRSGFQHFTHHAHDPASLASNRLNALLLDHKGRLWAGTSNGLDRLLPDGKFHHYAVPASTTHNTSVYALLQGNNGRLWVGAASGLLYLDRASGKLHAFQPARGSRRAGVKALATTIVNCLMRDRKGRLWVGTKNGVFVLSTDGRILAWLRHRNGDADSLGGDAIRALAEDVNGTIWVGTYGNGLDRLTASAHGWTAVHIRHSRAYPDSLSSNNVLTLFTDSTGLLWIGTYGGGFDIYNPHATGFGTIRRLLGKHHGLASDVVWDIYRAGNGNLWVATQAGLTRITRRTGRVRQYHFGDAPAPAQGPTAAYVVHGGRNGSVWVVTSKGLYRNHGPGTRFHKLTLKLAGGPHSPLFITELFTDRKGRLWVTSSAGVLQLNPVTGRVLHQYRPTGVPESWRAPIQTMCQTSDGTLWLAGQNGLRRFSVRAPHLHALPTRNGKRDILADADILSCRATPGGNLWLGTANGLVHYRIGSGVVHVYDTADGLPSAMIYALLRDKSGHIWAATGRGLARINPHTGHIRAYGRANGLVNEEFNQLAAFAAHGTLYFGGSDGVTVVHPAHLATGKVVTHVGITGYKVAGRNQTHKYATSPPQPLRIKYWQNLVAFQLSVFDYAAPRRNRFRFRLQGFNKHWQTLPGGHTVTYTNLDPGHYTLHVRGIDAAGHATSNVATLPFYVEPPPWWNFWAWVVYAIIALAILVIGLYLFAARIRRRRDLAGEQQRRRWAEALRELVHAISQLEDERAIAAQLVEALPELIPHGASAFYVTASDGVELLTTRGFDAGDLKRLQAWGRHNHARILQWCQQSRALTLDGADAPAADGVPDRTYLALPLSATGKHGHFLLIARDGTRFSSVEMELAAVLARQVRVVLHNVALIQQLQTMAHTDALTGASSRAWFTEQANGAWQRCNRNGRPLSMLLIDVDHFKRVNDTHGHAAGDAVLATLVQRWSERLRAGDIIGRYGGEEFIVCLPEAPLQAALATAERLRECVDATTIDTPDGAVAVTVSIGVASGVPGPRHNLDALITRADESLYAAKRGGRNRVGETTGHDTYDGA